PTMRWPPAVQEGIDRPPQCHPAKDQQAFGEYMDKQVRRQRQQGGTGSGTQQHKDNADQQGQPAVAQGALALPVFLFRAPAEIVLYTPGDTLARFRVEACRRQVDTQRQRVTVMEVLHSVEDKAVGGLVQVLLRKRRRVNGVEQLGRIVEGQLDEPAIFLATVRGMHARVLNSQIA